MTIKFKKLLKLCTTCVVATSSLSNQCICKLQMTQRGTGIFARGGNLCVSHICGLILTLRAD